VTLLPASGSKVTLAGSKVTLLSLVQVVKAKWAHSKRPLFKYSSVINTHTAFVHGYMGQESNLSAQQKACLHRSGREESTQSPQALRRGEHMDRVGFEPRSFFPLGWQVTRVSSYMRRPFPSKETPGPPVVPRGQAIGLGSRTLRERIGDWGGLETVWALLCVAERRATRPLAAMCWAPSAQVSPRRGVVLTDHQSSIDCQYTSLSLSLSLSQPPPPTHLLP